MLLTLATHGGPVPQEGIGDTDQPNCVKGSSNKKPRNWGELSVKVPPMVKTEIGPPTGTMSNPTPRLGTVVPPTAKPNAPTLIAFMTGLPFTIPYST